jgi:hypothetical protein
MKDKSKAGSFREEVTGRKPSVVRRHPVSHEIFPHWWKKGRDDVFSLPHLARTVYRHYQASEDRTTQEGSCCVQLEFGQEIRMFAHGTYYGSFIMLM